MVIIVKKWVILFITLSLLIGIYFSIQRDQNIQKNVETLIIHDENMVIGINYPKTGISPLDTKIKNQVDQIYQDFIKEYGITKNENESAELNIDYHYNIVSVHYINIVLEKFISSNSLAHPINEIYTYVYDSNDKRFLGLEDLITQEELEKLVPKIQKELMDQYPECFSVQQLNQNLSPIFKNFPLFTFTNEDLNLYFNPYEIADGSCGIIDTTIPLDHINLKIEDIELGTNTTKEYTVLKETSKVIDPHKKMIAITFDDGPGRYTKDILKTLTKYDANATFFVLGNKVEVYDETAREIVKQGSEIGNHSYNHKWLIKLKSDDFMDQVNQTQSIVKRITGITPKVLRPTYGSVNDTIRKNTNLDIVLWNVDTLDWKIKDPKQIANRVVGKVEDGDIVLMHDTHKRTVEALKIILPELKKEGFQFVTVSELKEAQLLRKLDE